MSQIDAAVTLTLPGFELNVEFKLPGIGVSALFGHSGCGKTTCLRILAGLETRACGTVRFNGELWQDSARGIFIPPHQRDIGYVFQEASLFPHLNVRENLLFGMRKHAPAARPQAIRQIAEQLGIERQLNASVSTLSGGERQRVAIARALLTQPRMLLLDEPLAALDVRRKREILPYLERLHDELNIPMIYVSHAPNEVAQLADYLVILEQGRVLTHGPLNETLTRLDLPGHYTDDAAVVIAATVGSQNEADHLMRLDFAGGHIYVSQRDKPVGTAVRCRVMARDVSLALVRHQDTSILNAVEATVHEMAITDNPAHLLIKLDAAGTPLLSRITARSAHHLDLQIGMKVWAQIKSVALFP